MKINQNRNSIFFKEKIESLDLAVIFVSIEGIQHQEGGVAKYTRNFIYFLVQLRSVLEKRKVRITVYAAEPALIPNIPTYNEGDYKEILDKIKETGGNFFKLINNTVGNDWISKSDNWKILSASASTIILNIAERHQACMAIFGGTCLSTTQVYVHKQLKAFNVDIRTIYMINDSAFSSFYQDLDENILSMDYICTYWTKLHGNAKIGFVSEYTKELFSKNYYLQEESFVPTRSGIIFSDSKYKNYSEKEIKKILSQHGIPHNRKIVMSWGRAIGYKRLDLVFGACSRIGKQYYPVVITNGLYPALKSYFNSLKIDGQLIEQYKKFELINALLQWKNTICGCFLSEEDPGAIAPMEAMYLAHKNGPVIIANNTGIYSELIQHGINGFVVENSIDSIANTILDVSSYPDEGLKEMRENAYRKVTNNYNQAINYVETLVSNLPFLKECQEQLYAQVKTMIF